MGYLGGGSGGAGDVSWALGQSSRSLTSEDSPLSGVGIFFLFFQTLLPLALSLSWTPDFPGASSLQRLQWPLTYS